MNQISIPPAPGQDTKQTEAEDPRLLRGRRRAARLLGGASVLVLALMIGTGAWIHLARDAAAQDALDARQNAVPVVCAPCR